MKRAWLVLLLVMFPMLLVYSPRLNRSVSAQLDDGTEYVVDECLLGPGQNCQDDTP